MFDFRSVVYEFLCNVYLLVLIISCSLIFIFVWNRKHVKRSRKRESNGSHECPKNTVIFHQTGRGPFAPSLTPFSVKLETYLRMAEIPYQNVHDKKLGPKGKVPWIEYNGEVLADAQLIMEHFNRVRSIDLDKHLTPEQKSVAVAFQRMVDEHTYWLMVINRWKYDADKISLKLAGWGFMKRKLATMFVEKQTYYQGLGRHNKEEILGIMDKDFKSLSVFLGNKKFMFGDEPCELDCSLFGQLSQFKCHLPLKDITDLFVKYPNLTTYFENMRTKYWSDWNECVMFPATDDKHKNEKEVSNRKSKPENS